MSESQQQRDKAITKTSYYKANVRMLAENQRLRERVAELEEDNAVLRQVVIDQNEHSNSECAENQRLREALEGLIEVIEEEDIDVGFSNIYTKKLIANAALGRSDTDGKGD